MNWLKVVWPIVAQGANPLKHSDAASANLTLSTSSRVGVFCLACGALWWLWLVSGSHAPSGSRMFSDVEVANAAPLAVVNPANAAPSPRTDAASVHGAGVANAFTASESAGREALGQGVTSLPIAATRPRALSAVVRLEPIIVRRSVGADSAVANQGAAGQEIVADNIPQLQVLEPLVALPTPTPTVTPTPLTAPTPTPHPLDPGRLWSTFVPRPASEIEHFWIGRPFPPHVQSQLASPSYQFGSTAGDRYRAHHGVDISNPLGTPVLASGAGEVVHAGLDDPLLLGPYNNFYGNAVVIRLDRRLPVAGGELDVFVLLGHLSEVLVSTGQRVEPGDVVGLVGMTGIAIGPHLHLEIRVGGNTYEHSVNPELWVQPLNGGGAVAVRLLTSDGHTWPGGRVSVARFGENGAAVWAYHIETYRDVENLNPDPVWGENGAVGSVPPGRYLVFTEVNGERLRAEVDVLSGQTSFVEFRTQR